MKAKIVLLSLCVCLSLSVLDIYEPKGAKQTYNGSSIGYTVANFGHIPYGKSLIGTVIVASPFQNCQITNNTQIPQEISSAFLLIKRGTCAFVEKVRNAEKMGAKLAIVTDNIQQNTGYLTMKDNGNGYLVNIPSILISETDGERLVELAKAYPTMTLRVEFATQKSDKVNLTIYTEANNRMTYHFIRTFKEFYPSIKTYANVRVVPNTISCHFCKSSDCIADGKYCSINYDLNSSVSGSDVVKQQLREQIVSRDYLDSWWDYMDQFDQECDNLLDAKNCSAKIFKKLGITPDTVENKLNKQIENQNLLNLNTADLEYSGTTSYPSVLLNNERYKGNLKASYVFEQICGSLTSPPDECLLSKETTDHGNTWLVVFIVIIGAFILFAVIFYFYKRYLNKQLSLDMSSQVSEQVSKYIEFYSSRQNQ